MRRCLYIVQKGCGPCEAIWEDVFKQVSDCCKGQVSKIDGMSNPGIAREFNIKKTPTAVFLDDDGDEYGQIFGRPYDITTAQIIAWLKGVTKHMRDEANDTDTE